MAVFIGFIVLCVIVILGAGIVSSVVLGVGTLLSRVFSVSVFEASLVVLVAGALLVWFVPLPSRHLESEGEWPEEEEEEELGRVWIAPLPGTQRRKKRRRG